MFLVWVLMEEREIGLSAHFYVFNKCGRFVAFLETHSQQFSNKNNRFHTLDKREKNVAKSGAEDCLK